MKPGELTLLIGPNGAGKTTLFDVVSGMSRPDTGSVWIGNQRIDGMQPWTIAGLGVGRLFQEVRIFSRMTVLQNVMVALPDQIGDTVTSSLLHPRKVKRQQRSYRNAALSFLEAVSLGSKANRIAGELSFGQQKLLGIARLLASDCRIFLVDEPTAGIHPAKVRPLLKTIRNLVVNGKTVLMIEHNLTVVSSIADRTLTLDKGCLISDSYSKIPHENSSYE